MDDKLCALQADMLKNSKVMLVIGNLARLGYISAVSRSDDGVWVIDYAKEGDLKKPAIKIEGDKIKLPKGSSMDLLEMLLRS